MPTTCVATLRCGTHATGWLNGAHPTVEEGKVTRKVCFNWSWYGCCTWSINIEVLNCSGGYFLYHFRGTPLEHQCNLRYCGTDWGFKCLPGKVGHFLYHFTWTPPEHTCHLSYYGTDWRFKSVSMGWWLLRLSAKTLALLRLSVNFFQLRLTKKLKINVLCFKELNINKRVFFLSLKQNKGWQDHLGMK